MRDLHCLLTTGPPRVGRDTRVLRKRVREGPEGDASAVEWGEALLGDHSKGEGLTWEQGLCPEPQQ